MFVKSIVNHVSEISVNYIGGRNQSTQIKISISQISLTGLTSVYDLDALLCIRQQNIFRYTKYTCRTALNKKNPDFRHTSGCTPDNNLLFLLRYIRLGCSPGCFPLQQIILKTPNLKKNYVYIVTYNVGYNVNGIIII